MHENNEQLLSAARNYVTEIFNKQVRPEFVFHNIDHTEEVVEACSRIAENFQLSDEDKLVLFVAAWFHDTGYTKGEAHDHETESIRHATEFLTSQAVDEDVIQRITSCIEATRMPQSPVTLVEKILCDGDLYHLATTDFKAKNSLLKQERETLLGHKISKKEWRKSNIVFLSNHKYFTDFGKQTLEPKKLENLNELKGKKDGKEEDKKVEEEAFPYAFETDAYEILDPKEQQKNIERGIQTMFRTTSANHFQLSSLADGKSNIMISVNAIIVSVVLSVAVPRLATGDRANFAYPTILLVVVCLTAMVFAILATRPSVSSGEFNEEDIRNKKTNLLFFGNFHNMKLDEYQWGMNELLKDRDYLYNSMIKDIYFLGVVLAKKYKLLRISYTIFMWGLILVVIAFSIAYYIGPPDNTTTTFPKIDY